MTNSKSYFDSLGAGWDALQESFYSERVRDRALEAAGVESGRIAADLGAGTGFVTRGLVARGLRVVAVDQSAVMLEALRRKYPWTDKVETRVGVAEKLPIADSAVDYCFANMFLHHVESPAVAIAEMARVLKPGGRAVVTDLDRHEHAFLRDEHHDRWMGFEREDVRGWFRDAGFEDLRVGCVGEACCGTSGAGKQAVIGIFVAAGTV